MTRKRWGALLGVLVPIGALLALLAWGVFHAAGSPGGLLVNSKSGEVATERRPAPSFSLEPLAGGPALESASFLGRVVLVDFWSSWCPPCRIEAPTLAEVYREYRDAPVEFVGIAIWDDPAEALRLVDRYDAAYPQLLDDRGRVAISFGVQGLPEKFFLDRNGIVVRKYIGSIAPDTLRSILDDLLASS